MLQLGAKVSTVANGEEAISLYKKSLDMTIVGSMDGIEVGKKILNLNEDANIIICTGHTAHLIFKEYSNVALNMVSKSLTLYQNLLKQ